MVLVVFALLKTHVIIESLDELRWEALGCRLVHIFVT
jgi:hypothetical protein